MARPMREHPTLWLQLKCKTDQEGRASDLPQEELENVEEGKSKQTMNWKNLIPMMSQQKKKRKNTARYIMQIWNFHHIDCFISA